MMGIRQRTRLAQKRRWRPSFADIISKTIRKYRAKIVVNITRSNALYRRLLSRE